MKRKLSLVMAIVMVLSFSSGVLADNNITQKEPMITHDKDQNMTKEQFVINGEPVDISITRDGNIYTAVIFENNGKTTTVIKVDKETGRVTYNGVPVQQELISTNAMPEIGLLNNWRSPTTKVYSLSFLGWGIPAIVTVLSIKFGIPLSNAGNIAQIIIGAGGFLYVKEVVQLNYVDYAPKVGYRMTTSLHLTRSATGNSLFTRTVTGSR